MKISKAEFTISAVGPKQYPQLGQPEIALVGRSNVGKSSLINKFINRKGLARTSSQPGKTQTLNFYHLNEAWFFVDLPGYGYAKVSKAEQHRWGRFIDEYLTKREELVGIIQLVDIRHPPTKDDITMAEWLKASGIPFIIVANKADKISRGRWSGATDLIKKELGLPNKDNIIVFSAENGAGLPDLMTWVTNILRGSGIDIMNDQ
ncbi:MAG: ribosome biogenesis GTP-binding protein YihA/YsxC [Peptococcia bacterium]